MKSDYISDLIIIALLCVGYIYINNRISEYQGETYLWKKLLGESVGIQFTGTRDETDANPILGFTDGLIVGQFGACPAF